jgi:hypothetical protein
LFLVAVLLAGAIACAGASSTRDYGPPKAIAAVRHDLPLLLAASLKPTRPTIDWVITDGEDAIATWHVGAVRGLVAMELKSGRWWWRAAATRNPGAHGAWTRLLLPGGFLGSCPTWFKAAPSVQDLLAQGFVNEHLVAILSRRLEPAKPPGGGLLVDCRPVSGFANSMDDGYYASFLRNRKDHITVPVALTGRGSTIGPSGHRLSAVTYYAFDFSESLFELARFRAGATLDVWFPYVLDKRVRYVLYLRNIDPEIVALPGKLENNTLHFTLPAFGLRAGTKAHGEIAKAMP